VVKQGVEDNYADMKTNMDSIIYTLLLPLPFLVSVFINVQSEAILHLSIPTRDFDVVRPIFIHPSQTQPALVLSIENKYTLNIDSQTHQRAHTPDSSSRETVLVPGDLDIYNSVQNSQSQINP